jgi:octaprenyl-diphosphate synthase
VREGKVTLPLLLTLKRSSPTERDAIAAVLKNAARRSAELQAEGVVDVGRVLSERELAPVIELVERHHGVADTNRRAREHVARAAEAIAPYPDGPSKSALLAAADFAVGREA